MLAQNSVSQADFEAAEATVAVTRAQIEALEAQIVEAEVAVEIARVDLGYTKITAPIDGTVLAIVTQEGQTVNATQSAPTIIVIGQIDVMTVRAEISEADIVRVRPGQQVRSEEHTSELQSLMRISYAVFCLNKNIRHTNIEYCNGDNHMSQKKIKP